MRLIYILLSGAHVTLPIEEAEALHEIYNCPYEVLSIHKGVILAKGKPECSKRIVERSAYIKEVGVVERIVEQGEEISGKIMVKRIGGANAEIRITEGDEKFKLIITEGFGILGRPLAVRKRGRTARGPFFAPGSLDPLLARAMVNIARTREGDTFLDPFCGTGAIAIEACLVKAFTLCSDLDPAMVYGSRINLGFFGCETNCLWTDAMKMPIKDGSVEAIATDPPYGRSIMGIGARPFNILESFLYEASRILRRGSWLVFATSSQFDVRDLVREAGMRVKRIHVQRVHGSLARLIWSVKKE